MHCKYTEGDFFRFKLGRRQYGFGRILLNIHPLRKKDNKGWPHHYGLGLLFGKPLVVTVYPIISDSKDVDIAMLSRLNALLSQYIIDNVFFYGECEIIGNLPCRSMSLNSPSNLAVV